jgi:hypothetical protein
MCMALIQIWIGRIRIGMPWMPMPIWIQQNDADPTRFGSGSSAQERTLVKFPHSAYFLCFLHIYSTEPVFVNVYGAQEPIPRN